MSTIDAVLSWIERQARKTPLLTRSGELPDPPKILDGLARSNPDLRPNQVGAESSAALEQAPEVSNQEFADEVLHIFDTITDVVLQKGRAASDRGRGVMLGQLEDLRRSMIRNARKETFESFRQNGFAGPLPGTRELGTSVSGAPRENPSGSHVAKIREADRRRYEDFRRVQNEFREGVDAIYGIRKSAGPRGGRTELVMVYYDAGRWTPGEAETHAQETFSDPGVISFSEADGADVPRENSADQYRVPVHFSVDDNDYEGTENWAEMTELMSDLAKRHDGEERHGTIIFGMDKGVFYFETRSDAESFANVAERSLADLTTSPDAYRVGQVEEVAEERTRENPNGGFPAGHFRVGVIWQSDADVDNNRVAQMLTDRATDMGGVDTTESSEFSRGMDGKEHVEFEFTDREAAEELAQTAMDLLGGVDAKMARITMSEATPPGESLKFGTLVSRDDGGFGPSESAVTKGMEMPFPEDILGRDNPDSNFHAAKVRESDDDRYETYRRDDDPDTFERGIHVLYGIRPEGDEGPEGGRSEIVTLYYPAGEWNPANAQRHAEDSFDLIGFDAATSPRENQSTSHVADAGESDASVARVTLQKDALPETDFSVVRKMSERTARNLGGELVGLRDSATGAVRDLYFEFETHDKAHRFASLVNEDLHDRNVDYAVASWPPRINPRASSGVDLAVKLPREGGQAPTGKMQQVEEVAQSYGGRVIGTGMPVGSAYTGLHDMHLRLPNQRDAVAAEGDIEELFGEWGIETRVVNAARENSVTMQSERASSGESAVSLERAGDQDTGVEQAAQMGRRAGRNDNGSRFADEKSAFEHALETLSDADLFADAETAGDVGRLEEAAEAWTRAYGEASGADWRRKNPSADEGSRSPRAGLSFLGLTTVFLGGGIMLADTVLREKRGSAGATG